MTTGLPIVPSSIVTGEDFKDWCQKTPCMASFTGWSFSHGRLVEATVVTTPEEAIKHVGGIARQRFCTGYLNYLFIDRAQRSCGGFELSALPGPGGLIIVYIERCHKCVFAQGGSSKHMVAAAVETITESESMLVVCIRGFVNPGWRESLEERDGWGSPSYDTDAIYYPVARLLSSNKDIVSL